MCCRYRYSKLILKINLRSRISFRSGSKNIVESKAKQKLMLKTDSWHTIFRTNALGTDTKNYS